MDWTDINKCLQVLQKRHGLFSRKDDLSEKLRCLGIVKEIGQPGDIYSLFEFLRSDNILIKIKAAEAILFLFNKLESPKDYADALKHLPVKTEELDFYRVDFDEQTYVQLLGLASVNASGYIREKAIKDLARTRKGDGLKFIFLRLGDWVPAVRTAATEAIFSFLEQSYLDDFLVHLRTIEWLLKVERVDLSHVYSRIIQFVLNQDHSEQFFKKVHRLDDQNRLLFYKAYLNSKQPDADGISRLVNDRSFLIRLELLNRITEFDPRTQAQLITRFLTDQSARVRQQALYASQTFSPDFYDQIQVMLSDEAASVRALSRYILKDEMIDFTALYKSRIVHEQHLAGSILGLSETGSKEHLPLFSENIYSRNSKVVIACLTAIYKHDIDKAKEYALERLSDPVKRFRDKSVEILAGNAGTEILQKARDIYAIGDDAIKRSILILYNRIGGWSIVGDLLLALTNENENIANLGWQSLDKWKTKAIRLFTTPSANEKERTEMIYNNLDISRLKLTSSRATLLQDLKFFLR